MKAIYLDCFSGISGNMLLGAFIDAGVPADWLQQELKKLPLAANEYDMIVTKVSKCGIQAIYADTKLTNQDHHEQAGGHHHHHHRSMHDIELIIESASLTAAVKEKALKIFWCLAKAEGKVHGKATADVNFHEVGAIDSIVDIVGIAICLEYLHIEKIFVGKINAGSGFVECAHGIMPVPAPATAELLQGWQWYQEGNRELTTPTGAAFIAALAEYSDVMPAGFKSQNIAYGAGSADMPFPNVLRLYSGDYEVKHTTQYYIMETNIDDMNSQIFGYLYERLFAIGALDVWTTPIFMKKNRPAQKLSVLITKEKVNYCADVIFKETTTIGIRVIAVADRLEAERKLVKADTEYGKITCKMSTWRGKTVNVAPEYDECIVLAKKNGEALKKIQLAAIKNASERGKDE